MKGILIFVVAVIWGSLSGQFLVQVVTSFVVAAVCITATFFSKVPKSMNLTGAPTSFAQSIMFGILFVGGNWITSEYIIDYNTWNAVSIASLLSCLGTIIYVSPQVSGKILLARMCAWSLYFMEASMQYPASERVAFAWKCRAKGL